MGNRPRFSIAKITRRRHAEYDLRGRLHKLANNASVMVWVTEKDGTCTFLSESWYAFTGQTPETGLGFGWLNAVHPDDREASERTYREANARAESFRLEYRLLSKDGEYRWMIDSARPNRNDSGEFLGYIGTVIDINERKLAEQRQAFLLKLSDTLRPIADPMIIQSEASRSLAAYLRATRVHYAEIEGAEFAIRQEYTAGAASMIGRYRLENFGPEIVAACRRGETIVMPDVNAHPTFSSAEMDAYRAFGTRSYIVAVLIKGGEWVAALAVHSDQPREWTALEVALVEEVAERTWDAVERARTEAASHESEEKLRTLFNSIDEGLCICEMLVDEHGQPRDYRFLEVNPMFEPHTGLKDAVGKTALELVPDLEKSWIETYGKVALTGEPLRFTQGSDVMGRWFDVYAFRMGDPQKRQFGILFTDITERRKAEAQAREMATMDERQRLARELHDAVTQMLFASTSLSETIPRMWQKDTARAMEILNNVVQLNRGAWAEMRKLLLELRPEAIERTSFPMLLDHLAQAAQAQRNMDVDLHVHMPQSLFLPADAHTALYRIAQEAFNNILKHSRATAVEVRCTYGEDAFHLGIRDNGVGFDGVHPGAGMGMTSMRERAGLIGAQLRIASETGKGTQVTVQWASGE